MPDEVVLLPCLRLQHSMFHTPASSTLQSSLRPQCGFLRESQQTLEVDGTSTWDLGLGTCSLSPSNYISSTCPCSAGGPRSPWHYKDFTGVGIRIWIVQRPLNAQYALQEAFLVAYSPPHPNLSDHGHLCFGPVEPLAVGSPAHISLGLNYLRCRA